MKASENRAALDQAREAIPFLNDVPNDIYFGLDDREWVIPQGIVAQARRNLEKTLGHNVMTYNRKMFFRDIPIHQHLCAHLEGAELTEDQRRMLNQYESAFRGQAISFVVYKKPLTVMPVKDSFIYKSLREKNNL